MKGCVVLLISLLLSFSSYSCFATTTSNIELPVVRDTNGKILRSDTRYFVVSAFFGAGGGGVRRGYTINEDGNIKSECPTEVIQSPRDTDLGMSVYFKPKARKQKEILESTDVNIEFYLDNPTFCPANVWKVDGYPGHETPLMFLSTNGKAGNPLEVDSWFQIKKVNDLMYKLVFCPHKEPNCSDIGIKVVDGQRQLAIRTGNTFYVVFMKDPYIGINSII